MFEVARIRSRRISPTIGGDFEGERDGKNGVAQTVTDFYVLPVEHAVVHVYTGESRAICKNL